MNDIICYVENIENVNCTVENTVYIEKPITQEKQVTPTREVQKITPDPGYTGLSQVTVDKISDNYIIPTGEIQINQNGIYNVKDKVTANVNIPEKQLGTKTITTNGIYKATDDNLDGYSEVEVETSGVDINDYFVTTVTNSNSTSFTKNFIKKCPKLTISSDVVSLNYAFADFKPSVQDWNSFIQGDTSNVQTMENCFSGIQGNIHGIEYIAPSLNTQNVTTMSRLFNVSYDFVTIPEYNAEKVVNIFGAFANMLNLVTFGGLKDLGKNFDTTQSDNYFYYRFDLSSATKLTHESLMNIINNLYDIKTKGCNAQSLVLGSTNIAKLTSDEVAIATNKGWNVS